MDASELRRLRLAIEASGEIIFTTDASGTFTYVNPTFGRVYGYRPSEVIGRATPRILKGNVTPTEEYAAFWRDLTAKRVVRREFTNRTSAGQLLRIDTCANPIVDDLQKVVGFLAVQRDVTAQRELEFALRDSEQRYRTLADAAEDAIFIVDRDGRVQFANMSTAGRLGTTDSDIVGHELREVIESTAAEEMLAQCAIVFDSGQRHLFEQHLKTPDGPRWLEVSVAPLRTDGAEVQTIMGVARNITVRKVLEADLRQAQKMEAIGRLAGGIAHDFNNVLTAILGYCELLEDRVADSPQLLVDVEQIRKAGERASQLTRQLLTFSRKQASTKRIIDLNVLLRDLHRMLERVLGEDVLLSIATATDAAHVLADPVQVEQVVLNLAVNARDAMPKGGSLTIAAANVHLDEAFALRHPEVIAGPHVSLSVTDTGCGISADILPHIFEPFFTTKPKGQGTGLGLSTVFGIVKLLGGCITAESRPGAGSTMTILLPRQQAPVETEHHAAAPSPSRGGRETILLIEDDRGVRSVMRKTLESYGYRILEADDAAEAVALGERHRHDVDLLLSDVIMPGLNGPDLAQRIVRHQSHMKVLYVSGFGGAPIADSPQRKRVWHLAKPFTPLALAARVRECLDAKSGDL